MTRNLLINRKLMVSARRRLMTAKPVQHRRNVFIALLLVFMMGSASQPPLAQAARDEAYTFALTVTNGKKTLCLGEVTHYTAYVYRTPTNGKFQPTVLSGVKVSAYAANPSIGTFSGAKKAGTASQITGFDLDVPSSVEFTFTAAKKPGKSKLFFEGAVGGVDIKQGYVSDTVDVKVITCKFKVRATTWFPVDLTYNPMIPDPPIKVVMDQTVATVDADGNLSGYSKAHWHGFSTNNGCSNVQNFGSVYSIVDISGTISGDSDQIELTLTQRDAVGSNITVTCDGASAGGRDNSYLLDPVSITVSINGGKVTVPQSYVQSTFTGSVTITVIPVKEK